MARVFRARYAAPRLRLGRDFFFRRDSGTRRGNALVQSSQKWIPELLIEDDAAVWIGAHCGESCQRFAGEMITVMTSSAKKV